MVLRIPHAKDVQYPQRQLLGFSPEDKRMVERLVIDYLGEHK
ncbi:TPA: phage virion morphogenesis protein [Enterobacter ludwigii]